MFDSCFEICKLLANAGIPFELFYGPKDAYIAINWEEVDKKERVAIKKITDILSPVCVFVFDEEENTLTSFNNPDVTVEIIDC